MPTPPQFRMFHNQSPRWLLGVDALVAVLLMVFIATWALTMPSPVGPAIATAVALCFPGAMVLGVVNGIAMARSGGSQP